MSIFEDLKKNITLLMHARSGAVSNSNKAMVAFLIICILYVLVFLLILVFWGETYGLNTTGVWMTRVAVGALIAMSAVDWVLSKDASLRAQYMNADMQ